MAFVKDALSIISGLEKLSRHEKLSGSFGLCAEKLEANAHYKSLTLKDGAAEKVKEFFFEPSADKRNFFPKLRSMKNVDYTASGTETPSIDANLSNTLKKFFKEEGMLTLSLYCSKLSDQWVELFSSWQNLNFIILRDFFSEHIFQLLEKVLRQESLLKLGVHRDGFGIKGLDLFNRFLEQKQFLSLLFLCNAEDMKRRIMGEHNLEKFAGSIIKWMHKVQLHDASFEYLGRVDENTIQFQKKNLIVSYIDNGAREELNEELNEEFMARVEQSEIRFL
ncbi:hypothetical protein L596_017512 [Steinernema carpocapsae]|uniref:Uncharacterized protein n=1 Tax=Steinernema carpocapsae TaxID=34508 RepID=A0A4U5N1X5_STECR|nr:hypothetical protein L596_017512 [Steinernema carpocapsae]